MTNPNPTDYQLKRRAWKKERKARLTPEELKREKEQRKRYNEQFRKEHPDYLRSYLAHNKKATDAVKNAVPPAASTHLIYTIETIETASFFYNGEYYPYLSCPQPLLKSYLKTKMQFLSLEDMRFLEEDYQLDQLEIWYLASVVTPLADNLTSD